MNKGTGKRKAVGRPKSRRNKVQVLERDQWSFNDIREMPEVKCYIEGIGDPNRGILLIRVGRHKGRVRVRADHIFRAGDVVYVRHDGAAIQDDMFNLVGTYGKRGRRLDGGGAD